MMVKVCGINDAKNYNDVVQAEIDMVGLNFYPGSKRYVIDDDILNHTKESITKVGVFVNESLEIINYISDKYDLDYIQCHGGETAEFCKAVQKNNKVIKVFSISKADDLNQAEEYNFCDLFLFDTKTINYGGSGNKFDWKLLENYKGETPFLLAGGIGPEDIDLINEIKHPKFQGVDLNSKFEIRPGYKDIDLLNTFINKLNRN